LNTADFAATRAAFHMPEGVIYLDGNSLGPLPRGAAERVAETVTDEWGEMLITGWNRAGWMAKPFDPQRMLEIVRTFIS